MPPVTSATTSATTTTTHQQQKPGGDDAASRNLTPLGETLAGAAAGALARIIVAPLDVLKIRYQLQVGSPRAVAARSAASDVGGVLASGPPAPGAPIVYTSMLQSTRALLAEEGLRTLWRGNVAALALWTSYAAAQFSLYKRTKAWLGGMWPVVKGSNTQLREVVVAVGAGGVAGGLATVVTYPLDWARTRYAGQGVPKLYTSVGELVRKEYAAHGWRVFFQGVGPSVVAVAPQIGVTFLAYEHALAALRASGWHGAADTEALVAGAAAGVVGKLAMYPLDTVKKRLQVGGMQRSAAYGVTANYAGAVEALVRIAREEGVIAGWYKGTVPSLWKAAAGAALTFWGNEAATRLLARYPAFTAAARADVV